MTVAGPGVSLTAHIRDIADFPKPGILFRDITPLLGHSDAFAESIRLFAKHFQGQKIDSVVAAEARGFIFAAPLAIALGAGFVPVRKPGKLPHDTHSFDYDLEYGTDTLQMHVDGVGSGKRVLCVDDLLATGGTIEACCQLVERCGGIVAGCAFLIELVPLKGRERIGKYDCLSLIQYS